MSSNDPRHLATFADLMAMSHDELGSWWAWNDSNGEWISSEHGGFDSDMISHPYLIEITIECLVVGDIAYF